MTVANVPPASMLAGADEVDAGTEYLLTIPPVTDPGTDTVTHYHVHWGDGSGVETVEVTDPAQPVTLRHTYTEAETLPVIVLDVEDEDGVHAERATLEVWVRTALVGDISGDDRIDLQDFYMMRQSFATYDPASDLNGDGRVDLMDFFILRSHFGNTRPTDRP